MTLPLLTDQKESPGVTFAEPGSDQSFASSVGQTVYKYGYGALIDPIANPQAYKDIFTTAERSTRLTGNMVSESASREEAYDRRIAAVKAATGIDLENPERGGYAIDARKAIRDEVRAGGLQPIDAKGGVPERQRALFDQKIAALQKDHPDLDFGSVDTEARTLAKGAADAAGKAAGADVNPVASLATQFAGGLVGSRRDPLFIGSLFAGPTSAVGRTALARIASSSLFTGLFNAGLSAVEQPTVQDWRAKIGMESGIIPAIHEVGMAFALGMIPGAAVQGVKEGLAKPLGRVLANRAEPGDAEAVRAGLANQAPREAAALGAGVESSAADQATLTIPTPKDVAPQLHDDMLAAALKRADDPAEPSPEAVRAVHEIKGDEGPPHFVENVIETEAQVPSPDEMKNPHMCYSCAAKMAMRRDLNYVVGTTSGPGQKPIFHAWAETLDGKYVYDGTYDRWFDADKFYEWTDAQAHYRDQLTGMEKIDISNGTNPGPSYMGLKGGPEAQTALPRTTETPVKKPPITSEIERILAEAQPKSEREAVQVADEALDDIGRRESMAVVRDGIDAVKAEQDAARAERLAAAETAEKPARGDVMGKIPWLDDDGKPKLLTPKAAAAIGERDDLLSMLVRSCK